MAPPNKEYNEKKKKVAVICAACALALATIVVIAVGITTTGPTDDDSHENDDHEPEHEHEISEKAVATMCQPTTYKAECIHTLTPAAAKSSDPNDLMKVAFQATRAALGHGLKNSTAITASPMDHRASQAIMICREAGIDSLYQLKKIVDSMSEGLDALNLGQFLEDIRVWTSGVLTFHEICIDSFENTTSDTGARMKDFLELSRELTTNALTIITDAASIMEEFDIPTTGSDEEQQHSGRRRLFEESKSSEKKAGKIPEWISDEKRRIMTVPVSKIKADVVVAKDGSGKVRTIKDALSLIPKKNTGSPFIIYIKEGIYTEHVFIKNQMENVIFIGDGPTKTRISQNRNFVDGYQMYRTATAAILGDGFVARDIGFENTAGPEKKQAVAARVLADYAVFYNCEFSGYKSTLYTVMSRQFYRDCTISGTTDFIFGNALAIFQNCKIIIRKPLIGQQCTVTAQSRTSPASPTAIILHNCTITADKDFIASKSTAYLGRPWKKYSRTVVIQSQIDDVIAPQGWAPWSGTFGLDTLFYAEYNNRGKGAAQQGRVKWAGVKRINEEEAEKFTPGMFFDDADGWIKPTGCPYYAGLVPKLE